MTFRRDGERLTQLGGARGPLVAVGWLSAGQPYPRGRAASTFLERFFAACLDPWTPGGVCAGAHRCELCVISGGPRFVGKGTQRAEVGSSVIFVPAGRVVYVAPSLCLHYLDAHEYLPPDDFCSAVVECPPMRSIAYLKLLRDAGLTVEK